MTLSHAGSNAFREKRNYSPFIESNTTEENIIWRTSFSKDLFLFALQHPTYRLCETTAISHLREPHTSALSLSLTTLICYRAPIAKWLSEALREHYHLSVTASQDIHTALHEALINAVVHGNLGIDAPYRDWHELNNYYHCIEALLRQPEKRFACIALAVNVSSNFLTLRISDEGDGYSFNPHPPSSSRQGLAIIRECSHAIRVLRGGRTLEIDFALAT